MLQCCSNWKWDFKNILGRISSQVPWLLISGMWFLPYTPSLFRTLSKIHFWSFIRTNIMITTDFTWTVSSIIFTLKYRQHLNHADSFNIFAWDLKAWAYGMNLFLLKIITKGSLGWWNIHWDFSWETEWGHWGDSWGASDQSHQRPLFILATQHFSFETTTFSFSLLICKNISIQYNDNIYCLVWDLSLKALCLPFYSWSETRLP